MNRKEAIAPWERLAPELKPCPFCGRVPKLGNYITDAAVSCKCGLSMRRRHGNAWDNGLPAVKRAWNRRVRIVPDQET